MTLLRLAGASAICTSVEGGCDDGGGAVGGCSSAGCSIGMMCDTCTPRSRADATAFARSSAMRFAPAGPLPGGGTSSGIDGTLRRFATVGLVGARARGRRRAAARASDRRRSSAPRRTNGLGERGSSMRARRRAAAVARSRRSRGTFGAVSDAAGSSMPGDDALGGRVERRSGGIGADVAARLAPRADRLLALRELAPERGAARARRPGASTRSRRRAVSSSASASSSAALVAGVRVSARAREPRCVPRFGADKARHDRHRAKGIGSVITGA